MVSAAQPITFFPVSVPPVKLTISTLVDLTYNITPILIPLSSISYVLQLPVPDGDGNNTVITLLTTEPNKMSSNIMVKETLIEILSICTPPRGVFK